MTSSPPSQVEPVELSEINPDAGTHPIPRDPARLAAALRAGERMLTRYPYLTERFGTRGRRFTASDSAWLATLVSYPQALVDAQVSWLGGVLAHRGVPQILLERQLVLLAQELRRCPAPSGQDCATLCAAATALATQRRARLEDRTIVRVERSLASALRAASACHWRGTGEIISSAVADQANGVTADLGATIPWLSDRHRFGHGWIEAIMRAVEDARAALKP
jgi:hypothetical protein